MSKRPSSNISTGHSGQRRRKSGSDNPLPTDLRYRSGRRLGYLVAQGLTTEQLREAAENWPDEETFEDAFGVQRDSFFRRDVRNIDDYPKKPQFIDQTGRQYWREDGDNAFGYRIPRKIAEQNAVNPVNKFVGHPTNREELALVSADGKILHLRVTRETQDFSRAGGLLTAEPIK
jgi:hypothetical protein